jgi:hypothetical protein
MSGVLPRYSIKTMRKRQAAEEAACLPGNLKAEQALVEHLFDVQVRPGAATWGCLSMDLV